MAAAVAVDSGCAAAAAAAAVAAAARGEAAMAAALAADSGCAECEDGADGADGADDADGGCVLEEAARGINRTMQGNLSALGHRNRTGWGSLRNRCTAHMCHHYRARRCSRYRRRSWGCGSVDIETTTESRNPRSRCRGCRQYTRLRARRRRNHHHRRNCRCLSIPPWDCGYADCGYVDSGYVVSADGGRAASGYVDSGYVVSGRAESADGGRAASGCAESADDGRAPPRRSRICTTSRCWHSHSDTPTGTDRMRSWMSLDMSL